MGVDEEGKIEGPVIGGQGGALRNMRQGYAAAAELDGRGWEKEERTRMSSHVEE